MRRIPFFIGIGLIVGSLSGCSMQADSELKSLENTNEVSSLNDADAALNDGAIVAPTAPTLSISATTGALNFKWFDLRTNVKSNTRTTLFVYNKRTMQENELESDIQPDDLRYTLPITPHRLEWDAISYRVEICTIDNCVSSSRVPVKTLLSHALSAITPSDTDLSLSFADDLAINANGNVAIVSSPLSSSAGIFQHLDHRWVQISTLTSEQFSNATDSRLRVAISASGDTVAIASASTANSPVIVVFDRLAENWIQTAVITPFERAAVTEQWDTASLSLHLSDNGERIAFAAQPAQQSVNLFDARRNQVLIFDRGAVNWTRTASLVVPRQHTRLDSISVSGGINKMLVLSVLRESLFLHEYSVDTGRWQETTSQILGAINPSADTQIVASHNAAQVSIAAWELEDNGRRSAVAWGFAKQASLWITYDSIRMPPTDNQSAKLRLAGDAQLQSLAVGWQAPTDANLALYAIKDQRWQHHITVPEDLNLSRRLPIAQSVAISADNSTVLVGTPNTGSGGVVTSFTAGVKGSGK